MVKIWLEFDSEIVVGHVRSGCSPVHPYYAPLVTAKIEFVSEAWLVRITHVLREGNGVVDYLTNYVH